MHILSSFKLKSSHQYIFQYNDNIWPITHEMHSNGTAISAPGEQLGIFCHDVMTWCFAQGHHVIWTWQGIKFVTS